MGTAWGGEAAEDWEYELTRPDGFPQIALVAGVVLLGIAAVIVLSFVPVDLVAEHPFGSLSIGMLAAALAFAAAWWPSLRHAATGWRIGNAVAYAGVALLAVVVAIVFANAAVRRDAENVRLIKIDSSGEPVLPAGVRRGPITTASIDFLRDAIAERRRRDAVTHDLGLDRLANAGAVAREPALLKDCGRFARSAPDLDTADRKFLARVDRFRSQLGAAVKDPMMRDSLMRGFDTGMSWSADDLHATNLLAHRLYDQAGKLCTMLAGRHWKPMGLMFLFSNAADLAAFRAAIDPWNALIGENQQLVLRQQARMRDSGIVDERRRY